MKKFISHMSVFIFLFIGLNQFVGYFYEKPIRLSIANKSHMKYLKWNDINNPNNKFDLLFLGSSRGYCAYNPLIIDKSLAINTYNMCTGSQSIIESYYIFEPIYIFKVSVTVSVTPMV